MSSPAVRVPPPHPHIAKKATPPASPKFTRNWKIGAMTIAAAVVVCIVALLWSRIWPFSEQAVVQDLEEASDSSVTIRSFHPRYFPVPGCVVEGLEFHHRGEKSNLIAIERLIVKGSYLGILTRHVPRITVEGGRVLVPPFGSNVTFHTQHSKIVVDEIVADGTVVEFASENPQKSPLRFEIPAALLRDVRWGEPIRYRLKIHNPDPPGEIDTSGQFGAWTTGHPGDTPLSGEYTFEHADLGVYGGISGILGSKGKFNGVLKHINIAGTTDTPDFEVKTGGHKFRLETEFDAFVDATHGNTFLKQVNAHFGRTIVVAAGSVADVAGRKGKTGLIDLTTRQGRIEDILGLFTKERRAPMSGAVIVNAKAEIPSGREPFLEKVKLRGTFGIDDGSFSKPETQKNVNELSAGARGENKEDPETVLTDLKGRVVLDGGIARFSEISFGIPGATAQMHGTYIIINHRIDLHGMMRVDTRISKTTTGMKALFLKIMDPFFKKKKKGEVVPVHIGGTYEHPEFGLDFTESTDKSQTHK